MGRCDGIHWLAPALMLGSLLIGILFAIGHHLFYLSLSGTVASETMILGSITYQQANTATGTAFAFIAKSSLVFAVAIAFVQVFWRTVDERQYASPTTIQHIDILYSSLNNVFALSNALVWSKRLTLLCLVSMAW